MSVRDNKLSRTFAYIAESKKSAELTNFSGEKDQNRSSFYCYLQGEIF